MVKSLFIGVELSIEIFCSEMTKTPVKNLQLSFTHFYLMFAYTFSVIPISLVNWEKFGGEAYWPAFENPKLPYFS